MRFAVFRYCNYSALLIFHWHLPPFCYACWCEASSNFMVTYASHYFFICTNYLTFCICNQPCIAFIYFLFISCFFRQMEKEPLPQSVEVLSYAAARAATFLVLATIWLRQCRIIIQSYVAAQATFAFSCRCYKSYPVSILCSHTGSDMMAEIPSAIMSVSILCSRTDCDTKVSAMKNNNVKFQSYAAMQTAMFIMATKRFQSYASLIGCFSFFLS